MQFITHAHAEINVNGTHLQGHIKATYQELVALFGKPTEGDADKVDAEWDIQFEDGTIATVYNWKNGKNYLGDDGTPVEQITEWHIGGESKAAVDQVQIAMDLHREVAANREPAQPGEAEFAQAKDMMDTLRATKGEAYADMVELTMMQLKCRDLVMQLVSALIDTRVMPPHAALAIAEAHTHIATRTISLATRHAKVEMGKNETKELIDWCEKLMDMEKMGAEKILREMKDE